MHSGQTDLMEKSTLPAKEERAAAPQEIEPLDSFARRHIGPNGEQKESMLRDRSASTISIH